MLCSKNGMEGIRGEILEDNHTSCQIRGRSECDIWKVVGDLIDYIFMLQVTEKNILFQDHKVLQFF